MEVGSACSRARTVDGREFVDMVRLKRRSSFFVGEGSVIAFREVLAKDMILFELAAKEKTCIVLNVTRPCYISLLQSLNYSFAF